MTTTEKKKRKRPTPAWRVPTRCPCGAMFLPLHRKHVYHRSTCRWRAWKVREGRRPENRVANGSGQGVNTDMAPPSPTCVCTGR
jgi:hypothetical protein